MEIVLPSPLDEESLELIKKLDAHVAEHPSATAAARFAMVGPMGISDHLLATVVAFADAADKQPILMRLDPASRAKVIMSLLGLVVLGGAGAHGLGRRPVHAADCPRAAEADAAALGRLGQKAARARRTCKRR